MLSRVIGPVGRVVLGSVTIALFAVSGIEGVRHLGSPCVDVLGHSQVSFTLDTYLHVMPVMLREAAEAMDRALNKSS
jgi:hypothetical protein